MGSEQVFPMNSGIGKASYANNSSLQKMVISKVKATIQESALVIYRKSFPKCMRIADLGCSSGPTALTVASYILDVIMNQMPKNDNNNALTFQVFLNDLPGNDFNTVFDQWLPSFHERLKSNEYKDKLCFVMAMPGSFYERLFPDNFIHFFHSSYSLHWLSKVPNGLVSETGEALNKGCIYITKASPDSVVRAYLNQFQGDFTSFLRYRSEEMVSGGCMILTMMGSVISNDPKHKIEIMGRVLNDMVSEGIIEEESVDNFNMPMYCPTTKEVRKVIEDEGSFRLQKLEVFKLAWDVGFDEVKQKNNDNFSVDDDDNYKYNRGKYVSNYMRAVLEPIFKQQFGENVMDDLFERFTHKIIESIANENWHYINMAVTLTKKQD